MNYENIKKIDPEILNAISLEIERQKNELQLIASENYASEAILEVQGCIMTNKYAEGYPRKRYYGGCQFVDIAEELAIERAKKLFGAEHANVQPHSGSQANMAVYFSVLEPGNKIMSMELSHGGHLSHGSKVSFSGKFFEVISYGVDKETETLDYDAIMKLAKKTKPDLIICGYSAYPRIIDFKAFHEIAQEVDAYLMADIAHIAGLVAAKVHPSPVEYADFVTSTTHKTLRGPRGGFILCKEEYSEAIDKTVFPGIQGGPLMHVIAAKAVCFKEALTEEFKNYGKQIVKNSRAMADSFLENGFRLVSGGTDNHLLLLDLRDNDITGKEAEEALGKAGITVNKNTIPFDPRSPAIASGIRIGTPAVTTRGMKESEMKYIAELIIKVLNNLNDPKTIAEVKERVKELCEEFPIYKNIKL
ncbi:MAG: serine hydroxymethyltransferase [Candidatus Altiarchaeales archaeon]|nr:MAG: serine hydroxymethyltransferase [Candidatus Altiarchaeales archaeon]